MSTAACARNSTAAWFPRRRTSPMAAPSTRSTSPPINRISSRSMRSRRSITGLWCRRRSTRSMSHVSRRSAGPRRNALIRRSTPNFSAKPKYSRSERHASVAARQRTRRRARQRPPRDLFPAGRLRRAGAHGAHFVAAASAQEQIAAPVCRRFRRAGTSDLRPADWNRRPLRQSAIASSPIPPSGNTPPTSFMSSRTRRGSSCKLRCVYCETDIEEETAAHFVVSDMTRKTFSPGLRALATTPADKLKHLIIYRSDADAEAAGFQPRQGRKKIAG